MPEASWCCCGNILPCLANASCPLLNTAATIHASVFRRDVSRLVVVHGRPTCVGHGEPSASPIHSS
jgi:hypothetical protein